MNSAQQELSDKYEVMKEALEKKEIGKVALIGRCEGIGTRISESKVEKVRLARDLEEKEEELMSLNKMLKYE